MWLGARVDPKSRWLIIPLLFNSHYVGSWIDSNSSVTRVRRTSGKNVAEMTSVRTLQLTFMLAHGILRNKSMRFHISNLIFTNRRSMGWNQISQPGPVGGAGGGGGYVASVPQGAAHNQRVLTSNDFKHKQIKTNFSYLSYLEKRDWLWLVWVSEANKMSIKFQNSNWVQPD